VKIEVTGTEEATARIDEVAAALADKTETEKILAMTVV
jgi:YbbR domain-containing protein